jgi:hypothetical protein
MPTNLAWTQQLWCTLCITLTSNAVMYTDKKQNKIFLIYKEIHLWLCNRSHLNFLIYEENFYQCTLQLKEAETTLLSPLSPSASVGNNTVCVLDTSTHPTPSNRKWWIRAQRIPIPQRRNRRETPNVLIDEHYSPLRDSRFFACVSS